jgi:hypothetical protein
MLGFIGTSAGIGGVNSGTELEENLSVCHAPDRQYGALE